MKTFITEKSTDLSLLIARITLGIVMFGHGAQKLFGWFGGYGFDGTMRYFTETVGLPYLISVLVILGESLGAIALVFGFLGRFMATSIFIIMIGAMAIGHLPNGFYMNWFGNQAGEGIEFDLLIFGLSLVIMLSGSGAYSIDAFFGKKKVTVTI
jgi:putative oxidoreductase